ncbi:MAG: branched-chain amino acid ABC transporter permease [Candidatus Aquicultorales bacterium]
MDALKKIRRLATTSWGQALILFALAVAASLLMADRIPTLTLLGIYAIIILGLTLFIGQAGQISIGHAAFFGIGAYTSAITATKYEMSPWLGILLAAVLSGVVAYAIAKPTLRLKGHYLAMATLGFAEIVHVLIKQLREYTSGTDGITGIPSLSIGTFSLDPGVPAFYYMVWGIVAFTMFVSINIVRSRVGRALRAVHGSEIAAQAMGVNTAKYKSQIFVFSAVLTGLAGSLFTFYMLFISPESFTVTESVVFVTMVVVGGMSSLWGGIVGAGLLTLLEEYLRDYQEYSFMAYGTLLVCMMVFMPDGLAGAAKKAYGWMKYKLASRKKAGLLVESEVGEESAAS